MRWITDPRFFSAIIVVLFAAATVRWAFARDLKQTLYWGGAFLVNYAVVFMRE
jgi:hypothetical protein